MSNKRITLSPDETIALPEAFPMPPHTVFSLIEYGWRPYHAQPDTSVYENFPAHISTQNRGQCFARTGSPVVIFSHVSVVNGRAA